MKINLIVNGFYGEVLRKVLANICRENNVGYLNMVYYNRIPKNLRVKESDFPKYHALLSTDRNLYDPNTFTPLDEKLINGMAQSERIVMKMIDRLEVVRKYTYQQRLDMYYFYLRYWNHIIETKKINLFISANIPHEIFDYVIYGLCKYKKIPVIFLYHQSQLEDTALLMHDWKDNCLALKDKYCQLKKDYKGISEREISLPQNLQQHFEAQAQNSQKAVPFYMRTDKSLASKIKLLATPLTFVAKIYRQDPKNFIAKLVNPVKWGYVLYFVWKKIALVKNLTNAYYNLYYYRNSLKPDYSSGYIYVPLQYQPELSTSPLADVYVDQILIIQMISKYLPKKIHIYVKEHPKQTAFCRSIGFYKNLKDTKNVVLVRKDSPSFDLIGNSLAVATSTGTPGWEALFRRKPVLMFGSYIYQFADGVYQMKTSQDCQKALQKILKKNSGPSLKSVKLYLKALGEVSFPAVIDPDYLKVSQLSEKENITNITQRLNSEIKLIYRKSE